MKRKWSAREQLRNRMTRLEAKEKLEVVEDEARKGLVSID